METSNTNLRPGTGNVSPATGDTPPALRGHLSKEPIHGEHQHLHEHEHAHEHARAPRVKRDMSHIQGWGADLDRKNRPAVPMERTPPRLEGAPLPTPTQQPVHEEVLVSPERPAVTPLFGTPNPPKGLSGVIRRLAFKTTENDIRHWLLLLLADRVDMVEGIGQDLAHGKVPNVLAEMGIKAEWQHNKRALVGKVAVAGLVAGAAYYLLTRRDED